MMDDKDIRSAFSHLLNAVADRVAAKAALRARGELSEEEFVNSVLDTIARIAPDADLPIRPGAFVSPAPAPSEDDPGPDAVLAPLLGEPAPGDEEAPEILTWILERSPRTAAGDATQPPEPPVRDAIGADTVPVGEDRIAFAAQAEPAAHDPVFLPQEDAEADEHAGAHGTQAAFAAEAWRPGPKAPSPARPTEERDAPGSEPAPYDVRDRITPEPEGPEPDAPESGEPESAAYDFELQPDAAPRADGDAGTQELETAFAAEEGPDARDPAFPPRENAVADEDAVTAKDETISAVGTEPVQPSVPDSPLWELEDSFTVDDGPPPAPPEETAPLFRSLDYELEDYPAPDAEPAPAAEAWEPEGEPATPPMPGEAAPEAGAPFLADEEWEPEAEAEDVPDPASFEPVQELEDLAPTAEAWEPEEEPATPPLPGEAAAEAPLLVDEEWEPEAEAEDVPDPASFEPVPEPEYLAPAAEAWEPEEEPATPPLPGEAAAEAPLLADEEWEPGEDDLFADLPLPPSGQEPWQPGESAAAPTLSVPEAEPLLLGDPLPPASDDPFADLPLPPGAPQASTGQAPKQAPPRAPGQILRTAATAPSPRPRAEKPSPPPAPKAKEADHPGVYVQRSRPAASGASGGGRPRVIVSGNAGWERDDSHQLEDTMFRLGLDEDMAADILAPSGGLKDKDREFITKETRRALEGARTTKSPGTAFLLSLLLPGLGCVYVGRFLGILFAVPALALGIFLALGQVELRVALMGYAGLAFLSACLGYANAVDENQRIKRAYQPLRQERRESTLKIPK